MGFTAVITPQLLLDIAASIAGLVLCLTGIMLMERYPKETLCAGLLLLLGEIAVVGLWLTR
jgi:hypothetical protein